MTDPTHDRGPEIAPGLTADEKDKAPKQYTQHEYRAYGIAGITVGLLGLALWWGFLSLGHVNFVNVPMLSGIALLAGAFLLITSRK